MWHFETYSLEKILKITEHTKNTTKKYAKQKIFSKCKKLF